MKTTYKTTTKIAALILMFFISISLNSQIDRSKLPEAGPAPKITLETPQEFKLKNGLKVLVVENHKLPRVSYSLRINNKPIVSGDKAGIESLISSMMDNGTTTIPKDKFNEEIDFLGARLSLGVSGGFASTLSKYSNRILELMADAAINPLFSQEEFDKEKAKLLENLKANEKDIDAITTRVGNALSYGTNHPYGEFTTKETVNNVTYNDAVGFYNKHFNPNNAYLVVIGDVKFKSIKKQIKKHFSPWQKTKEAQVDLPVVNANLDNTQINFVDFPNATQSSIYITNNADLKMSDPDYHSALIANNILGGGGEGYLFKNLREEHGYTYGAYSRLSANRYGAGRFSATAKVRNMVTDSAVVEALKEINRIKNEPVNPQTLKDAKAKYVGNFIMSLERPQTIANFALNIKLNNLPEDFYSTYLKKINNVTAEDVKRVANKYIKSENARVLVVGKGSEVIENLEKTGIPIAYFDAYANKVEKPTYQIPLPADITANKVLNAYIAAIGGRENLDKINSVLINAEAELQPGVMMNLEMKKTSKKQFSQEISAMGQSMMKQVFNGETGYMVMRGQRKDMTDDELKKTLATSSPFPEVNYLNQDVTLEKIEKIDGENAYKIKVSNELSSYYSLETGLKIKDEQTTPAGASSIFYSEYQTVSGVKFPFKMGQTMGPRKIDFAIKEIKVNQGVSDVDFN
ncbi:M16 family metallopeptidase [Gelatiniphilus marinus]|uniref:M16 family metallopeptidase n=1 Tax=Gelatiniphilus marinus TaxID=1759464 RepID=A0ABW5JS55_9FLAO